jgi:hypothetical protein
MEINYKNALILGVAEKYNIFDANMLQNLKKVVV